MQSDLFAPESGVQTIPLKGGALSYYKSWLNDECAQSYLERLLNSTPWEQPEIIVAGNKHPIPRLQAWYGDSNAVMTYSKVEFRPLKWTDDLISLKDQIESETHHTFNSVLVNLYRDGQDGVGWHADNEPELGVNPVIASLSLGVTRTFSLKPKIGGKTISLDLNHGDLIVMSAATQSNWLHSVPKTATSVGARINLTFRNIKF